MIPLPSPHARLLLTLVITPGCVLFDPPVVIDGEDMSTTITDMSSPEMTSDWDAALPDQREEMASPDLKEPVDLRDMAQADERDLAPGLPEALRIYTRAPRGLNVAVNMPLQLYVEALDKEGEETWCEPTWGVLPERDGEVSASGELVATNPGELTVSASCAGLTAAATVVVSIPALTTFGAMLQSWYAADHGLEREGAVVSAWGDPRGGAKVRQSQEARRPSWIESVPEINHRPALRFEQSALLGGATHAELNVTFTLMHVVRGERVDGTEFNYVAGHCNDESEPNQGNHHLSLTESGSHLLYSKATFEGSGERDRLREEAETEAEHWSVRTITVSDDEVTFYEQGEEIAIAARDPLVPVSFHYDVIGGWCSSGPMNRFTGEMAELLFFQGDLNALDRAAFELYLMTKYDLMNP